jgi:PAS domain S-box-containing protein
MRDLAALATLPSIWIDSDVRRSIQNLAEVLRAALRAFAVCVRVELPDALQFDAIASEGLSAPSGRDHEAAVLLNAVHSGSTDPVEIPRFNGAGPLTALPQPIFFEGRQIGYFLACYRHDVPRSPTDCLLLHVAASQIMLLLKRHKDQEELRRKNNQLAAFLDTAALGLHRVGPDGTILWANAAEMQMLGYTPEEYIGHHIAEFHADRPVIDDILKVLACGATLHDRQARLRCKDGSIKHVLIDSSVLWEDGKFVHTQCFTRDVTDRKRDEEKAARLAAIVEHSEDAIFSCDLAGNIKSWNRGAERLYGYPAAEATRQHISFLLPQTRLGEETGILDLIRKGQAVENYETLRQRKDGSVFHVSLTVSPVKDPDGNVIGVSKVARDITDKVRARDKLEQAVAERTASLMEAIAQMEEFSYSVSHDLRGPLRAMRAYSQALLEDYGSTLDSTATDYVQRIFRSSDRMEKLTHDVLTYSRLARAELPLTEIDLDKLVVELISQYTEFQKPAAEINVQTPLLRVRGHETSLGQCIANLLSNAIKFVPSGKLPAIRVRTDRLGDKVRFWVEDNGIGIQPEHQGRLFQMFERLNRTEDYQGTGIGLAIVRKGIEKMGGSVGVVSDGRNGSRFWLELPKA